jgi:hypothetical protein
VLLIEDEGRGSTDVRDTPKDEEPPEEVTSLSLEWTCDDVVVLDAGT